jgi:glutathionyl-hydroquinone reductase
VTVPVLYDTRRQVIVNNESSEIIRMLNGAFDAWGRRGLDLYPEPLRPEIDAVNALVYEHVNNGVYRAGFATSQDAYEAAYDRLFETLDELERRLGRQRYLVGDRITEADWRLFTTLVRFDAVYYGHFKCNRRRLDRLPEPLGLHPGALPGAGHRGDGAHGPYQAALLRQPPGHQPDRHRPQGAGAGLRGAPRAGPCHSSHDD